MSNRTKMQYTNGKIKDFLKKNKWEYIYVFPHSRFMKDYVVESCGFDMLAWKHGEPWLIQCKTNLKPSKAIIEKYKLIEDSHYVRCAWINRTHGKIEIFTS